MGGANILETKLDLFKFKQYESEIILLTVRWYLKYSLSYRNLVEMMEERGLHMAHTTIKRWVHQFGPELYDNTQIRGERRDVREPAVPCCLFHEPEAYGLQNQTDPKPNRQFLADAFP